MMAATTVEDSIKNDLRHAASRLPSSARIFEKVNQALSNPDVNTQNIIDTIRQDTAIALRVLRLANSAQFVRGEPFDNLEMAVDWIGLENLFHLLTATVSASLFCEQISHYRLSANQLGHNAIATATAMNMLAKSSGECPRRAYSLGLFRPVGRMLLERIASRRRIPVPINNTRNHGAWIEWEKTAFSITNTDAVFYLFGAWGMHPSLGTCIQHHYQPQESPESPEKTVTALLHVACWVAEQAGYGLPVEQGAWSTSPEILELANLTDFQSPKYIRQVREITERLTTAK